MSIDFETIEAAAKTLRQERDGLNQRATLLSEVLAAATRRQLPGLRKAVAAVADAQAALEAAIELAPHLFNRPRSMVLHGIRLGYRKGTGKIQWEDDEQLIRLIRRHFPEQFDVLCQTTEKPVKDALAQLTAAELKKIGVTIEGSGDVVFVKDATTGVDKLVKALLKGVADEEPATQVP